MGVTVNSQKNHDHPYVWAIYRLSKMSVSYDRIPWLWLKPIRILTGYEAEFDLNLKLAKNFITNVIAKRREKLAFGEIGECDGQRKIFLDLLLNMEKKNELTNEDIIDEVETIMVAGYLLIIWRL